MSINVTIELSKVVSTQDLLQLSIADLDRRMDSAILAESDEDISAIRFELSKLKASLGQSRNSEAFWRQQISDAKEARKAQGDIARG
ncbi:MAG: hypothetical protein HOA17_07890 [Candidatus Melainabacteria bacterium]|jgi:hypothetical protein|nr:hypothetical protein [Candidatus Melainabacteria bacterium]